MKPKVRIRQVALPLAISYAVGLSLLALVAWFGFNRGETFRVRPPSGDEWINIRFIDFIGLGIYVVVAAFIVSCISLTVNKIALYVVMAFGLGFMVLFYMNLGQSVALLLLAYIIGNIALFRGRSRIYVLSLGYFAFFYQFYSILARTDQNSPATAYWLIAINIFFASPIFYAIYKYIPKQNQLKVEQ